MISGQVGASTANSDWERSKIIKERLQSANISWKVRRKKDLTNQKKRQLEMTCISELINRMVLNLLINCLKWWYVLCHCHIVGWIKITMYCFFFLERKGHKYHVLLIWFSHCSDNDIWKGGGSIASSDSERSKIVKRNCRVQTLVESFEGRRIWPAKRKGKHEWLGYVES